MSKTSSSNQHQLADEKLRKEREKTINLMGLLVFTAEEAASRVQMPRQGCGWGTTL